MKKKIFFATLLLAIVIMFVCYGLFLLSKSRTFQFFGGLTSSVTTRKQVVALTFDDAPSEYVDDVLRILKEKQIRATFYEIGRAIEQYPAQARAITQAGMEIGNHSYSHERFLLKSQTFINNEIQKTNTLIRQTGYTGEITFRPPNGKKLFGLPWYLHQHDIKTIMWDVEPDTYSGDTESGGGKTSFIVWYTLEHTRPGSIILIHPFCKSCDGDRKAIPQIIDKLREKGYTFVTISELLTYQDQ